LNEVSHRSTETVVLYMESPGSFSSCTVNVVGDST